MGRKDAAAAVPGSAFSIGRYAIPFRVPGSQRDRQILHYFCVRGSHEIASYFNIDFWTKTVLQQSHQESVVRQALVSLGALHLDFTTTGNPGSDSSKQGALAQYGRAIHALRKRVEKPDHDTVKTALTCCILFYCFEAALGDSAAALRHLDSGLNLLSNHLHHRELKDTDDFNRVSQILERLDMQATVFDDGRSPRMLLSTEVLRDEATFRCLDDACWVFIRLQNSFVRFLTTQISSRSGGDDSLLSSVREEKRLLQEQMDAWFAKFEQSQLGADHDEQGYCGAKILLISWHVSKMLLEAQYPTNDSISRASANARAHEILDMAHEVLDRSQGGSKGVEQDPVSHRRTFSSESGIVAPIFGLAAKFSDETVCARALEMLHKSRRREGLYDGGSMAEAIYQFRSAKQQRSGCVDERTVQGVALMSLEKLFVREINGVVGGMDKPDDGLNLEVTTTGKE